MSRYIETAAKAQPIIESLAVMLPADRKQEGLQLIAEVFLMGMRSNPRPAQSTVKLRACETAFRHHPVRFRVVEVPSYRGGTFKAISIDGITAAAESSDED